MINRTLRLVGLMCVVAILGACSAHKPQNTLADYADALAEDDSARAYALLTPELRGQISPEAFARDWPRYRERMLPLVSTLRSSQSTASRVQAELVYSDYDDLQLRLTEDGWKITDGLFRFYAQDTPRQAIISFVRAMEERRFDVLMRFIPSSYAKHMTAETLKDDFERRADEINAMIAALKANMHNPIQTRRDHAYMPYGEREVTLVLEGNAWKIEDPD